MSHDRLERLRQLNRTRFKRHTGIYPETFAEMEIVLDQRERSKKKSGRLPGRKSLKQEETVFQIIAVDAAETPCERPTRQQRRWYSGKKKRHTLKTQVVIDVSTRMILCVATAFGSMHDLTLFRQSGVQIHPETALIGDAGYQGIRQHHGHSVTPHKATKKAPLTPEQRQQNRELASTRLRVEHVIRCLKIFRVLKDMYRHRRRRFSVRVNLIAAVCNRTVAGVA